MIWRSSLNSRLAQAADFITVFLGLLLSYEFWGIAHLRFEEIIPVPTNLNFYLLSYFLFVGVVYVFIFNKYNAYSYQRFKSIKTEYSNVIRVSIIGFLASLTIAFFGNISELRRTFFIISFFIVICMLIVEKTIVYYAAQQLRKIGRNRKDILIVGTGFQSKVFIQTVRDNFNWGLNIIGMLTDNSSEKDKNIYGVKVVGNFYELQKILHEFNPDEVVITVSLEKSSLIKEILNFCELEGVNVRMISNFWGKVTKKVRVDNVYGLSVLSFEMTNHSGVALLVKRIIDIIISLIAIISYAPFMIIAAIGILISDGRPILYSWYVVGLNKKPFKSWKFRTMVKDADKIKDKLLDKNEMQGPVFKIKNDPRIIPFGKWLRKYSIDETPQLFSVLKGDMSLVGPRPAGPHELIKYKDWHRRKLSVKPGLTCLWQVNGRNKINNFDEWVKLDLQYIDNWSLLLDLKILLMTIPRVIMGIGAS